MGSTKKHKSEKKKKRSRSPERSKEKHRHHKRHHKDKKRKIEVIETEDLVSSSSGSDVEEISIPPPPKITRTDGSPPSGPKRSREHPPSPPENSDPTSAGDGKSHETLSIEETNKIRAKLGLKPLQVEGAKPVPESEGKPKNDLADGGVDMGEFVHKAPINISDKLRTEKIKQRISERKEKREIDKKLSAVKPLGEESDSEDDAKAWVERSRLKEIERKKAEERAKLLEELDKEFGVGDLVQEEMRNDKREAYTAKDLRGLKVEHALESFAEESSVILTLKDKDILNEEEGDALINVNMLDNERYKKNVELKKKKPGYDAYEDFDEEVKNTVLSKYDEEIEGEKIDSFSLGDDTTSRLAAIRRKLAAKSKLEAQKAAVSLNTSTLKIATDYYTPEELSAKFKKPGKAKKLRKKPKMLKADDLMPRQEITWPTEDLGSRRSKQSSSKEVVPMEIDIVKSERLEDTIDVDDLPPPVEDLAGVKIEPDESELELQLALSKARKMKAKEKVECSVEKIAKEIAGNSSGYNLEGPGGTIVLNSTAEFCRTLGDIPTYGLSGNREEDEQELMDFEREMKEEKKRFEEDRNMGAWNQVEIDERTAEILPTEVPILDAEPDVGSGVAGALRLALSKGYLEKETENRPSASRFAHLQAQNYSIEDKAHGDDDKFGRRDRYAGPTTDFKEKDTFKPNVKLEYIDDDGHILNAKEAFRYLSHKFHGKGPGKNKVEKRMKKNEQEGLMKQMSSTDTPLRTLTMLQQKQKETQSPFVVLSGNKQLHTTSISKTKH